MIVTAWNNGGHLPSGAGYGLKVEARDRDRYFKREWKSVLVQMEGEDGWAEINVDKPSFWDENCRELISKDIGKWLLRNGKASWKKGYPPKLRMEHLRSNKFSLYLK